VLECSSALTMGRELGSMVGSYVMFFSFDIVLSEWESGREKREREAKRSCIVQLRRPESSMGGKYGS